ncbi:MAG TPA: translation initiation factor IF-1 [Candidatus Paceibacterota bacterium]
MSSGAKGPANITGSVVEALPSTNFKVALTNGDEVICYLSGRMRLHRIRVLVGDNVEVTLDEYGKRGRITKRL